ncbi:hypothetical protein GCM10027446_00080 [Angustibacter peucedani]
MSAPEPSSSRPALGRVASLRSFPVKSMDAVEVDRAVVLPGGLEHDRGWAVADGDEVLTARALPQLRDVRAGAPTSEDGSPTLRLPGRTDELTGADADAALSQAVGRPVALRRADQGGARFNEVAAVHLVSRQAVERAAADEGTTLGDPACSVEEPRANVVLDLADDAGLETAWVGQELRLGDVVLRISQQPRHCLGVYAEVVSPGTLRVGDDVQLG